MAGKFPDFLKKSVASGAKEDVGAKAKKLPPAKLGSKKDQKPGIKLKKGDKG